MLSNDSDGAQKLDSRIVADRIESLAHAIVSITRPTTHSCNRITGAGI